MSSDELKIMCLSILQMYYHLPSSTNFQQQEIAHLLAEFFSQSWSDCLFLRLQKSNATKFSVKYISGICNNVGYISKKKISSQCLTLLNRSKGMPTLNVLLLQGTNTRESEEQPKNQGSFNKFQQDLEQTRNKKQEAMHFAAILVQTWCVPGQL